MAAEEYAYRGLECCEGLQGYILFWNYLEMLRSEDFNLSECWPSMCPYTSISTYTANSEMPSNTQSTTKKKQLTMSVMVKKTKDVTGCKVLSHPTTKQIQSFLRTLCHSTWRSARSSPARSLGRFKRVVLLQLEIGAKKHEVLWHIYIECLTLRHWRTY